MKLHPTRRHVARAALALLAAPAIPGAVARALAAADLQGALRFGTWGGSWRDTVEKLVGVPLRERGVELEYVLGNPSNNLARLIAARGREVPIDCLEDDPATYAQFMQGKFLQKIDQGAIPNAKLLPDFGKSDYYRRTVGLEFGIVYNKDKFRELGIAPPATFMDLANPKLSGHVSFPDSGNQDHPYPVVGLAYEAGGDESSLA